MAKYCNSTFGVWRMKYVKSCLLNIWNYSLALFLGQLASFLIASLLPIGPVTAQAEPSPPGSIVQVEPAQANWLSFVQEAEMLASPEALLDQCVRFARFNEMALGMTSETLTQEFADQPLLKTLDRLFKLRLVLRTMAGEFVSQKNSRCVDAIRTTLNEIRVLEDFVAVAYARQQDLKQPGVLRGESPYLLVNPIYPREKDGTVQLKSGDILLSRGNRFISAMIAKITEPGGLFSHAAIVYVDEKTGQAYTVEAHIEIGAVVRPISAYLKPGSARVMVLRHKDSRLAHQAAQYMAERVAAISETGENVPYDFAMRTEEHSELFCAEVPSEAYEIASKGSVVIPTFRSRIEMKNQNYLRRLGIAVRETFSPIDMDIQSDFDVVAEWRDLEKVQATWLSDVMMSEIYRWMDEYNYTLRSTPAINMAKWFAWSIRRTPLLKELVREKLPSNMSRSVIEVVGILDKLEKVLVPILLAENQESLNRDGMPLTRVELSGILEKFRIEDLDRYLTYSEFNFKYGNNPPSEGLPVLAPPLPRFHGIFRPAELP